MTTLTIATPNKANTMAVCTIYSARNHGPNNKNIVSPNPNTAKMNCKYYLRRLYGMKMSHIS